MGLIERQETRRAQLRAASLRYIESHSNDAEFLKRRAEHRQSYRHTFKGWTARYREHERRAWSCFKWTEQLMRNQAGNSLMEAGLTIITQDQLLRPFYIVRDKYGRKTFERLDGSVQSGD